MTLAQIKALNDSVIRQKTLPNTITTDDVADQLDNLADFTVDIVAAGPFLPLAGGTMSGDILFSGANYSKTIGASANALNTVWAQTIGNYSGLVYFFDGNGTMTLTSGEFNIARALTNVHGLQLTSGGLSIEAGGLGIGATNTAPGTTGNQTINKASGKVNVAAGGTTLTVTSSFCGANSIVLCTILTDDATATLKNVVPAAGSFIIKLNAAATAETAIGFMIIN